MTGQPENGQDKTTQEIVRAVERAFYAAQFRRKTFVIYFDDEVKIERYLMELGVLESYGIRLVILLARKRQRAAELLAQIPSLRHARNVSDVEIVISGQVNRKSALETAITEKAEKFVILSNDCAELLAERKLIYAEEAAEVVLDRRRTASARGWLKLGLDAIAGGVGDVIFLEDRPGKIFEEIFTFDGAGLMLTARPVEVVRRALKEDVPEIFWLLQPGMESGEILKIDFEDVLRDFRSYVIYTIDDRVVACGRLLRYGRAAEIAKFATLPRYRNSGKARVLLNFLVKTGRRSRLDSVFGLTTSRVMARLFKSAGFKRVARSRLPKDWRKGYDMTRKSMAYSLELRPEPGRHIQLPLWSLEESGAVAPAEA